jgi:hypothetical protein
MDCGKKHWKTGKLRHKHYTTWNMVRNNEKSGKWWMYTLGLGIYWKKWKILNMWHKHIMTWNMARNTEKTWKMKNAHCTIWNMAKNPEKCWKWEMHTIEPGIWQETWKNVKNETHTLEYRVYGEKTEKCRKIATNIIWPGIWRDILKNVENEKCRL